jgi:hypothetical protein
MELLGASSLLFIGQELGVVGFQGDEAGELGAKGSLGGGGRGKGGPAGFELAKGLVQGLAERGFARLEVEELGPGGGLDGLGLGAGHLEPLLQKAGDMLRRSHGSGGQDKMQNAECKMQNRGAQATRLSHSATRRIAFRHSSFCILHFALV